MTWDVKDKWWTSPFNWEEDVRKDLSLPAKVEIHDATLRDGEQTPGVVFRKHEKVAIAKKLDEIGVDRIEAGMPAVSKEDMEAIKEISSLGLNAKIMTFSRAMPADIDRAIECGADGAVVEVPSGLPRLKYQYNWSQEDIIERSITAVKYAKDKGLFVNFFPFDTTRAEFDFLKRLVGEVAEKAKPDSLCVVDTTGCILPRAMGFLVGELGRLVDIPIEVHTHNDLGCGIATSLAAVEAGAQTVHVCANGLGERTGNASLEEMAVSLKTMLGVDTSIKYEKLEELSQLVEKLSGMRLGAQKPLMGEITYIRETGLGIDALQKEPRVGYSVQAEFVGRKYRFVLGKKSGKPSIEIRLKEMGLDATEEQMRTMLDQVKLLSIEKKSWLSDAEFLEIAKGVLGN
ncbi:MAG: 3-hydroxy-3-methylglutaryl-CoA lyase [Nitrospinota bacterium]|jgi:methanogen homocitrate synthase|nr:3-hydroxy-3-methylglutaryl-CoA lyase [Nitrospinota bacterium]MDP7370665.1 3-hydroxy-3-methylglutaryl-CoA lyase [Nitrospinota bacterium]MDP7664652.1 3-hydroxy-3-methylglutaryl-CoA lyase [Nitrospinota bacterium]HJP12795.1 3-hydroxy-3-methylglutaryl-CoA lyase [Nitrospinota bacterium]|tara:strand:- start:461 stop:1663 length:1203 start_codon:yes stop_codon:yes gene_type:complete